MTWGLVKIIFEDRGLRPGVGLLILEHQGKEA